MRNMGKKIGRWALSIGVLKKLGAYKCLFQYPRRTKTSFVALSSKNIEGICRKATSGMSSKNTITPIFVYVLLA